jgi:excisionase family DNA binding protein
VRPQRPAWSGPCPDLTTTKRGRAGGSSAGPTRDTGQNGTTHANRSAALDAIGPAPLLQLQAIGTPSVRQLLTARAVAEMLDVCAETVLRWIRNGELPAIRLPGGAIRIIDSDLHDWLRSRATPGRGVLATTTDAADPERYPAGYDGRR